MDENYPDVQLLEALAAPYRYQILVALSDVDVQDCLIFNSSGLQVHRNSEDHKATQIELLHVHLPKLTDLGFIEWDRKTGCISKGDRWNEIVPLLEVLADNREKISGTELPGPASTTDTDTEAQAGAENGTGDSIDND